MYGRQFMGQQPFQQDQYQPMAPNVPGVLSGMPYQTAWLGALGNRSRDIDAAVDAPTTQPVVQKQLKVFQGQDGSWFYRSQSGEMRPTRVIHNPETNQPFYWDDDLRDFVPAE